MMVCGDKDAANPYLAQPQFRGEVVQYAWRVRHPHMLVHHDQTLVLASLPSTNVERIQPLVHAGTR